MKSNNLQQYLHNLIVNCPKDWLDLTTHRLDIYHEDLAKTEFLAGLEELYHEGQAETEALDALPTAYDYIRLGHPLSSVLEWALAKELSLDAAQIISFGSASMPLLAILRTNALKGKRTRIYYQETLPSFIDFELLQRVYQYSAEVLDYKEYADHDSFEGSAVLVSKNEGLSDIHLPQGIDFFLSIQGNRGSILMQNGEMDVDYISAIQHVRRRETIAMTPANCFASLQNWLGMERISEEDTLSADLKSVRATIAQITGAPTEALLASSGLSMQYAIMMGLIEEAQTSYPNKEIKIIVPPNCYGGTNDQARRVAASLDGVEVMDLPVDGDNDMVQSIEQVLQTCAKLDAVPLIIAEIPTNPRVEVPNLEDLRSALAKSRQTPEGAEAVDPVFILDQTFCPNVQFLKAEGILASIRTISYVSGSKFPSGGKCTAGYCVANQEAAGLMPYIQRHLTLCDNTASPLQVNILAEQMPSMNDRIQAAYENTREFVNFIEDQLPKAKINFVSEALAAGGFTPSVFSLDLPTKGATAEERENYKRALNLKLINAMIKEIPSESKYCVSYGQLKGCYWTIPATSTQGTTKEADKDYIARVSVSPDLSLEKHKAVFRDFVSQL